MENNEDFLLKNNQNKKRLKKFRQLVNENFGMVYITVAGLFSTFLEAMLWLILASLLNVDNYGLVNYYIAVANVAAGIGMIGLNITVMTYLAKGEKKILHEANSFTFITGILLAFALSFFNWITGILATTTIFFNMTLSELIGSREYKKYTYILIGQKITHIIFSLLLFYPFGINGILFGYLAASVPFSYRYFRSIHKNFTLNFSNLKEKFNFALHSYGYNLIGQRLANYLDKVIIGALFGYYILGIYQLGFQFLTFFNIIPMSLSNYLIPEEAQGKNRKEIKIIGLILSVFVVVFAYLLSPYVIQTLFPTFTDSASVVNIMSLAIIPSAITAIFSASHLGREDGKTVFMAGLIYLIFLLSGLVIFGSTIGVLGLAFSLPFARIVQSVYLLLRSLGKK